MRLIALRQLTGDYGLVASGQAFEVRDEIGIQLIKNNLAVRASMPEIVYEKKVVTASQLERAVDVGPFRIRLPKLPGDGDYANEETVALDTSSPRVPSPANLSKSRIADRRGRTGRGRGSASR